MVSEHDAGSAGEAITLPITDTMHEAAVLLKQYLTALQYDRLFESLIDVTRDELTDLDYGIVEADPIDPRPPLISPPSATDQDPDDEDEGK